RRLSHDVSPVVAVGLLVHAGGSDLPAERVVAIEVLWTPQLEGDTLSADALLTEYPELRLL
ncbi:MAG: DUF1517 domain-containing protein, partial [Thermostichus sp. BF3_bins_97]